MIKRLSYFNLVLALFIIIWGAWVRLSGSGAGCGNHWPLCNGAVVPLEPSFKTLTEFIHRLTSGLFGLTVLWAYILGFKGKNKLLKTSLFWSLFFTITEALIGAVLVKKGLVENNDSLMRGIVISLHLANTLGLLYFLTQNIYLSRNHSVKKFLKISRRELIIIFLFVLTGATGAIAALGNTLFPETDLLSGVAKDFSSSSHILINLRTFHPFFAISLVASIYLYSEQANLIFKKYLKLFLSVAICWGIINWLLMAPHWGALVHLLIADGLFCFTSWLIFCRRSLN